MLRHLDGDKDGTCLRICELELLEEKDVGLVVSGLFVGTREYPVLEPILSFLFFSPFLFPPAVTRSGQAVESADLPPFSLRVFGRRLCRPYPLSKRIFSL